MSKSKVDEEPIEEANEINDILNEALTYNNNIQNHLLCYTEFKPLTKVLIRVYRRLPIVTKSGLIIDVPAQSDWAKVMKQAGSGQDYAVNEVPTEFRFTKEAVVVALPDFQTNLKVGQRIAIEQLITTGNKQNDGTVYYDYMASWVHPSAGKTLTPSDCNDAHYGYALIPINFIDGLID